MYWRSFFEQSALDMRFFNVADGLAIVVFTHPLMNHLNPWLERRWEQWEGDETGSGFRAGTVLGTNAGGCRGKF